MWGKILISVSYTSRTQAMLRGGGRQLVNSDMVEFINPKHCGFFHMHGWTDACMDVDWCNVSMGLARCTKQRGREE